MKLGTTDFHYQNRRGRRSRHRRVFGEVSRELLDIGANWPLALVEINLYGLIQNRRTANGC